MNQRSNWWAARATKLGGVAAAAGTGGVGAVAGNMRAKPYHGGSASGRPALDLIAVPYDEAACIFVRPSLP